MANEHLETRPDPSTRRDLRTKDRDKMLYKIQDNPPIPLAMLFSLQQAVIAIGGTVIIPLIISNVICAGNNIQVRAKMVGTSIFMVGVSTILQVTFGTRLPIIQGSSPNMIAAISAMMTLDKFKCTATVMPNATVNATTTYVEFDDNWALRIREISGCLMLASVLQVIFGLTGFMGFLVRFIGPLTIAPTITLIGFTLMPISADLASSHWGISSLSLLVLIIFSLFLGRMNVPLPGWSKEKGCHMIRFPIFQVIPIILTVAIMWTLCAILTATEVFPEDPVYGFKARTTSTIQAVNDASWFYFPYPGQYGVPSIGVAGFVGTLAAVVASIIESVADYNACAKIAQAPVPPAHAINRGIAMEGLGSIISGAVGACHATTSYSENIGIIGLTKVGSRLVFIMVGVILVIGGCVGKVGTALATIPDPILGGISILTMGLLTAVGLSFIKYADCSSIRNLSILGLAIYGGYMTSRWTGDHPNAIKTGTPEERGISAWRKNTVEVGEDTNRFDGKFDETDLKLYDIPLITGFLNRHTIFRYCPFLPPYVPIRCVGCICCSKKGLENGSVSRERKDEYEIEQSEFETEVTVTSEVTSM
ncbi:unnamed protein product [Owenia fusiformis]|uniref:Uncharacterized protein n=1 Tax=Owenia fusiformis TaxID=6347 RepID=A0A8J1TEF6_OWEFU|nr:unnamed protein product [Owenia fusiformis]